ncbi:hypothetical protein [Paraburkholderia humisilvae]|nr:hypothetical protein [Paraburkholderia humisilvae]
MSNKLQLTSVTRDDAPDSASKTPVAHTAAQRQRAYRLRRKRAVIDAIGDEPSASRVTLLALLGQELAALDTGTVPTPLIETKRQSVKRILTAIVTRSTSPTDARRLPASINVGIINPPRHSHLVCRAPLIQIVAPHSVPRRVQSTALMQGQQALFQRPVFRAPCIHGLRVAACGVRHPDPLPQG